MYQTNQQKQCKTHSEMSLKLEMFPYSWEGAIFGRCFKEQHQGIREMVGNCNIMEPKNAKKEGGKTRGKGFYIEDAEQVQVIPYSDHGAAAGAKFMIPLPPSPHFYTLFHPLHTLAHSYTLLHTLPHFYTLFTLFHTLIHPSTLFLLPP